MAGGVTEGGGKGAWGANAPLAAQMWVPFRNGPPLIWFAF